ncbi:thioredoxin domain-containing protein [Nitrospirillum sp. BR 11164]|uniref:thioredoxin domain-containing protein n=1 Tax=Nitrospirillum sp. BR 11164 TaxID=3104324 RepID=UPI002AFF3342|nr:thioredoxin domain-containing protein [Nitrospirillum sp. BR 11164]MEA1651616.1 thioredoxin domain-containing protein [Nitrospirillum sp. BR 11164]
MRDRAGMAQGLVMAMVALAAPLVLAAPAMAQTAAAQTGTAPAPSAGGGAGGGAAGGIDIAAATSTRALGSGNAPVVIEEYASLSCPHCAHFEETMLPRLKADFIDPGQVRFVFHDTPTNRVGYLAHMATRCLPVGGYNDARSLLFSTQGQWLGAKDPEAGLKEMMGMAGLPGLAYDACVANKPLQDYIAASSQEANQAKIEVTPTVIIRKGGKEVDRIAGPNDYDKLAAALVKAGAKAPKK